MAHRINERNTGSITLEGAAKRRCQSKKITDEEKALAKQVIENVLEAMSYDKMLSEDLGHLHPESKFTDGGRFTMMLTGAQLDLLISLNRKL